MQRAKPLLALILICLLSACQDDSAISQPTVEHVAEFTSNAGIRLPASAQAVAWREVRGIDDALWLQVKMPANELAAFLARPPLRDANLTSSDYLNNDFRDFITTLPTRYRGGQLLLPNARVLNILIDESNATEVMVYMMWHET